MILARSLVRARAVAWLLAVAAGLGPPASGGDPPAPVRAEVGGVQAPKKLKDVRPRYPGEAKAAGLAGAVVLECVIDPEGTVRDAKVLQGVAPLTTAAVEAVRQWRYTPTRLNGVAVPVIMTVTVRFELSEVHYYSLLGSLDHDNEHVREAAAMNLGNLGSGAGFDDRDRRKAVQALERVRAKDPSEKVRAAAARSLSSLDGRPLAEGMAPPPGQLPLTRPLAWGTFVDPAGGGADAREVDGRILLFVPAGRRDLAVESRNTAAPRLLRPVDGDFEVSVSVGPLASPGPPFGASSYRGAGLLLWQDDRNYVRLESATYRLRRGAASQGTPAVGTMLSSLDVRYALFEVRREGRLDALAPAEVRLDDGPTDLRLERRGRTLVGWVRQAGGEWRRVGQADFDLPRALRVGVAAVSIAQSRLTASFQSFHVEPPDAVADSPPVAPPAGPAGGRAPEDPPGAPASAGRAVMDYDRPPKPVRIVRPEYPEKAKARKLEGTVLVEILIDATGRVVRARVLRSVPELDEAALACVYKWRFEPAVKHGEPVATIAQAPIAFRYY